MTAIAYSDCEAVSDNGRYALEARSPHNGTIRRRDGRKVARDDPRRRGGMFQQEFRYRLLDRGPRRLAGLFGRRSRVVWERWQPDWEESPHELVVSDDGWAVVRTHGFAPEVIAVAPDGRDALRVRIAGPEREPSAVDPSPAPVYDWRLAHLMDTTAGLYWTAHSRRYFFRHGPDPYFVWRTAWGQRLVLDLGRGLAVTDELQLADALASAVVAAEQQGVVEVLNRLSRRMNEVRALLGRRTKDGERAEHPLLEPVRQASSALHLAGVHRLPECVPFLREWEAVDCPSLSMGSDAVGGGWWLETQLFRPIAHHALKLLGEEPRGFPTYHFTNFGDNTGRRFPLPERLPDRRERAEHLFNLMSAEEVLRLLGSPDFVRRWVVAMGTPAWRAMEGWEYDFRAGSGWTTLRLTWEGDRERDRGRMVALEEISPYWLTADNRESEYLRF